MAAASRAGCRIGKGYNSIKGGWVGADAATAPGASAALPQASTGGWGRARMVGGKPRAPRGEGGARVPDPQRGSRPKRLQTPFIYYNVKIIGWGKRSGP